MAVYIIPIFCFGLVITGIVFIGIQQAADLAKKLADQSNDMETASRDSNTASSGRTSAAIKSVGHVLHP